MDNPSGSYRDPGDHSKIHIPQQNGGKQRSLEFQTPGRDQRDIQQVQEPKDWEAGAWEFGVSNAARAAAAYKSGCRQPQIWQEPTIITGNSTLSNSLSLPTLQYKRRNPGCQDPGRNKYRRTLPFLRGGNPGRARCPPAPDAWTKAQATSVVEFRSFGVWS